MTIPSHEEMDLNWIADVAGHHVRNLCDVGAIKTLVALPASLATWLFGGFGELLLSLILIMVIDFTLGFIRAWREHNVSSHKMMGWVVKFSMYGIGVILANRLDTVLGMCLVDLPVDQLNANLRTFVIAYLCISESISVLEHMGHLGFRVPRIFIKRLQQYRDGLDGGEGDGSPPTDKGDDK